MVHEGMVHALEEIQRLLRPDGRLIDIHPVVEAPLIEVRHGDEVVLAEPDPSHDGQEMLHAEDALSKLIERGLFAMEASREFDFSVYGSSVAELRDFRARTGAYDTRPVDDAVAARAAELYARVEKIMRGSTARPEVAYHERGRMTRLSPVR